MQFAGRPERGRAGGDRLRLGIRAADEAAAGDDDQQPVGGGRSAAPHPARRATVSAPGVSCAGRGPRPATAGFTVPASTTRDHNKNRRKVLDEMRREMRRDRAKYTILPLSDFCLMQITRQRVRDSVQISMSEVCPTCHGTGFVQSKSSLLTELSLIHISEPTRPY